MFSIYRHLICSKNLQCEQVDNLFRQRRQRSSQIDLQKQNLKPIIWIQYYKTVFRRHPHRCPPPPPSPCLLTFGYL